MIRSKLFLICPDCHLESRIRAHFPGHLYFLTALGSVFDAFGYNYEDHIQGFLTSENIKQIIIVNDCSCRFIQSVVKNEKGYETEAEEVLQVLFSNCQIELLAEKQLNRRAFRLAELNIQQQAQTLKEHAFIGNRFETNKMELKGMIYDRSINVFTEISLD